jgi:hypothetical protein
VSKATDSRKQQCSSTTLRCVAVAQGGGCGRRGWRGDVSPLTPCCTEHIHPTNGRAFGAVPLPLFLHGLDGAQCPAVQRVVQEHGENGDERAAIGAQHPHHCCMTMREAAQELSAREQTTPTHDRGPKSKRSHTTHTRATQALPPREQTTPTTEEKGRHNTHTTQTFFAAATEDALSAGDSEAIDNIARQPKRHRFRDRQCLALVPPPRVTTQLRSRIKSRTTQTNKVTAKWIVAISKKKDDEKKTY